jgi:hypothetical protein
MRLTDRLKAYAATPDAVGQNVRSLKGAPSRATILRLLTCLPPRQSGSQKPRGNLPVDEFEIGIGGLAAALLRHHRTDGSAYGGSMG